MKTKNVFALSALTEVLSVKRRKKDYESFEKAPSSVSIYRG